MKEELALQIGYEQFTAAIDQHHEILGDLEFDWHLSYDRTDVTKIFPIAGSDVDKYGEDELFGRAILTAGIASESQIAFALEYSREKYGVRAPSTDPWYTTTWSLIGEWQWVITPRLTTFLGGRIDENTYGEPLFSPRFALIYSLSEFNTVKALYTRSQRITIADDNRRAFLAGNEQSKTEKIDTVELRYEYSSNNSTAAFSLFHIDLAALGWDNRIQRAIRVGQQEQWGLEAEYDRIFGRHRVRASYAYTSLIDFELLTQDTFITAAPFGFGNDLSNWATNSIKIWYTFDITDKTMLGASLRGNWGYQGLRDSRNRAVSEALPFVNADWETA